MVFRVSLFPLKEGTDLWLYLKRQLSSVSPKSLLIGIHHCAVYEMSWFRAFLLLVSTKGHVHTHLAPYCPSTLQVGVHAHPRFVLCTLQVGMHAHPRFVLCLMQVGLI